MSDMSLPVNCRYGTVSWSISDSHATAWRIDIRLDRMVDQSELSAVDAAITQVIVHLDNLTREASQP